MPVPQITATAWSTANASLYSSPWTSDTQNRLFSLQATAAGGDTTFTTRYLGFPLNVSFKGKNNVNGTQDPCLCIMFPSDTDADSVQCRLFQPCNFVHLNAFEGYKPFPVDELQQAKAVKGMASGGWFKKVWSVYSKVEHNEYKHQDKVLVSAAVSRPKAALHQTLVQSGVPGQALSDDERLEQAGGDGGNDAATTTTDTFVDIGGPPTKGVRTSTAVIPATGRPSVGEKSPRIVPDFSTFEGCAKFVRHSMEIERHDKHMKNKNATKLAERISEARKEDPDVDSDDVDASSASEGVVTDDDGFDNLVTDASISFWANHLKKSQKSSSSSSTSSATGAAQTKCV
jgi:hypothetical protein